MNPRTIFRTLTIAATLAASLAIVPATPAGAQVLISVGFGPPALPVYAQPICPGDGYLWVPGYWAYGPDGYFWVPGTWVLPPRIGFLWTPGYWGWGGDAFLFHSGYWGPHVGFYGGINYGFGYGGVGYEGGYWRGNTFAYNRSVNNINISNVRNVYERPVPVQNAAYNHVSYNGGNGGVPYRASAQEQAALREQHVQPTGEQLQHQSVAARNPQQFAKANNGRPAVTAAPTPGAFRSNPGNPAAATRGGFGGANANRSGTVNGAVQSHGQIQAQPRQQAQTQPRAQPQAQPRQQYQPQVRQPMARPQPQAQPRQQMQMQPRAQPQAQPRPQPQPQMARPQPQQQARPAAPQGGGGHEGGRPR